MGLFAVFGCISCLFILFDFGYQRPRCYKKGRLVPVFKFGVGAYDPASVFLLRSGIFLEKTRNRLLRASIFTKRAVKESFGSLAACLFNDAKHLGDWPLASWFYKRRQFWTARLFYYVGLGRISTFRPCLPAGTLFASPTDFNRCDYFRFVGAFDFCHFTLGYLDSLRYFRNSLPSFL